MHIDTKIEKFIKRIDQFGFWKIRTRFSQTTFTFFYIGEDLKASSLNHDKSLNEKEMY